MIIIILFSILEFFFSIILKFFFCFGVIVCGIYFINEMIIFLFEGICKVNFLLKLVMVLFVVFFIIILVLIIGLLVLLIICLVIVLVCCIDWDIGNFVLVDIF